MNPKIKRNFLGKRSLELPATDKKGNPVKVKLPMSKSGRHTLWKMGLGKR